MTNKNAEALHRLWGKKANQNHKLDDKTSKRVVII